MINKIFTEMEKVDFKPFDEIPLWVLLSTFGGGKEEFLDKLIAYYKPKTSIAKIRTEYIKSVSYLYDERRLHKISKLQELPFLIICIDVDEERIKNIMLPLCKHRYLSRKKTILLSDKSREEFAVNYSEFLKIGLVSSFTEENIFEINKNKVIGKYFK